MNTDRLIECKYDKDDIEFFNGYCYGINIDYLIAKLNELKDRKCTNVNISCLYDDNSNSYKLDNIIITGYYTIVESDYAYNLRIKELYIKEANHKNKINGLNVKIKNDIKKETTKKSVDEYKKYLELKEKYSKQE